MGPVNSKFGHTLHPPGVTAEFVDPFRIVAQEWANSRLGCELLEALARTLAILLCRPRTPAHCQPVGNRRTDQHADRAFQVFCPLLSAPGLEMGTGGCGLHAGRVHVSFLIVQRELLECEIMGQRGESLTLSDPVGDFEKLNQSPGGGL